MIEIMRFLPSVADGKTTGKPDMVAETLRFYTNSQGDKRRNERTTLPVRDLLELHRPCDNGRAGTSKFDVGAGSGLPSGSGSDYYRVIKSHRHATRATP